MKNTFIKAFKLTIPVLIGYFALGISYGFLMSTINIPWFVTTLVSIILFTGSMQMILVNLLATTYNPLYSFLLAVMTGARHLFYGVSLLNRYSGLKGLKKFYTIYTMSDETFGINVSLDESEEDLENTMFLVSLLDQSYWVIASTIGAVLGNIITFNTTGIEFVMTALFTVMFVEKWLETKRHFSAIAGLIITMICLLMFGKDSFVVPAMLIVIVVFYFNMKKEENNND